MQSTNQKSNALQAVLGVFLHSCNTPQKVEQALAHMGLSVSVNSIHHAVDSLSQKSAIILREMGQSLLVGYAYDNFDIDFKTNIPSIEKSGDTLTHLTSGTLIYLEHGVTREHLRCSKELWETSRVNPDIDLNKLPPQKTLDDLINLHPEEDHPSGLTRRQRFNAWKFLEDLCTYGPEYFRQFKSKIPLPEWIDKIPLVKMRSAPARSMDIKQSTVAGNIQAILELLQQGGVGHPTDDDDSEWESNLVNIAEYVVLFWGDLGTGERINSLLEQRSIEATPWRRYQFVVFVMGLFHLKMACADALWRIFIEPKAARDDVNSLMSFVALHRGNETGTIGSKPGFRRMHEVIGYDGVALRLDAWRTAATQENSTWDSLEAFAKAQPPFEAIQQLANTLATDYVANGATTFQMHHRPAEKRDFQNENIRLMHQYFLLYEELSHSMNFGDIGRVETLFPPWIYIFKATGKHKYATHMVKHLHDVHFVYPPGLKHAVRYNMLVNPEGKEGCSRAPDWIEEFNNLLQKVRDL